MDRKTSWRFIPPKEELKTLYHGTHPECCGRPFSQREIAQYYTKKLKYTIKRWRVQEWLRYHKIETRPVGTLTIPVPPKEELKALYHGTHPVCHGRPFTEDETARYYTEKYNRSVSTSTISGWFKHQNIEARPAKSVSRKTVSGCLRHHEIEARLTRALTISVPSKEELKTLYHGTHPECCGRPFSQREIAQHYTKKLKYTIKRWRVQEWFRYHKIETRPVGTLTIPVPPKEELKALYHGTHPVCHGRPFSQREIAQYYTEKYNHSVSRKTVSGWLQQHKIKTRPFGTRTIPIPLKEELKALYHGTHAVCHGRPFSLYEIARYYTKEYKYPVSYSIVWGWFNYYKIETRLAGRHYVVPIPPKEELKTLYDGTHPICYGRPFSLYEIARYYTKEYKYPVSVNTVSRFFQLHKIETRDTIPADWRVWQDIVYKLAKFLLSELEWRKGHGKNKILTPNNSNWNYIEPDIIVGNIIKFIEAKRSDNAIEYKDIHIYPKFTQLKLVEFWILFGVSRAEIHYLDRIDILPLMEFNEDNFDSRDYEKIFVYRNADNLIAMLHQNREEGNKDTIVSIINRIRLLQAGVSNKQTSLDDFFNQ